MPDQPSSHGLFEAAVESARSSIKLPQATYRLQLNRDFTFRQAREIVEYLANLGISDVYCSPYLRARAESLHGYDICDHSMLNPSIGTEAEYRAFAAELKAHGLGQILDMVPNHMGIGEECNRWWMDLLEAGQASPYARYFDVSWRSLQPKLNGKVLLPILGDQYGQILENGEIAVEYGKGAFHARYYDYRFPISPSGSAEILRRAALWLRGHQANSAEIEELDTIANRLADLPCGKPVERQEADSAFRERTEIKERLDALLRGRLDLRRAINQALRAYRGKLGNPTSFDALDALLESQSYRFAFWRVALEEINYRRFFDVNDLAGIRIEDQEVFTETHRLVFRLLTEGSVTGMRIDHPDGLRDPVGYFLRLQKERFLQIALDGLKDKSPASLREALGYEFEELQASNARTVATRPLYLIVEKILGRAEQLPEDWPVWGTTGYEFAVALNSLFVASANESDFDAIYSAFIGDRVAFDDIVYEKKRQSVDSTLASEVNRLGYGLNLLSQRDRRSRDFTLAALTDAVGEVMACFPVYRTYIQTEGATDNSFRANSVSERDRSMIDLAITRAKRRNPDVNASIFDFIRNVLLLRPLGDNSSNDNAEQLEFVARFQQTTGPIMAKGVEDTAFYVYNRLVSLNEVGGHPDVFGISAASFHRQNVERSRHWPYCMISTSTHDTKRSEDVRARINALSELPREWRLALNRWSRLNARYKTTIEGIEAPDRNEEYFFYQTILGAWPLREPSAVEHAEFIERIVAYMQKAMREGKVNTSWVNTNATYEEAVTAFIRNTLARSKKNAFLTDFKKLANTIAEMGMVNSLAQTLLKLTSPGVPDIYQGQELWDFSLVDPDNRRKVDYESRRLLLSAIRSRARVGTEGEGSVTGAIKDGRRDLARELVERRRDGTIKLYITTIALQMNRAEPSLFSVGSYVPIEARGIRAENVVAFARRLVDESVIVVAPRLSGALSKSGLPFSDGVWGDTTILLSEDAPGSVYENLFTGEKLTTVEMNDLWNEPIVRRRGRGSMLGLGEVLSSFPVALLRKNTPDSRTSRKALVDAQATAADPRLA